MQHMRHVENSGGGIMTWVLLLKIFFSRFLFVKLVAFICSDQTEKGQRQKRGKSCSEALQVRIQTNEQ